MTQNRRRTHVPPAGPILLAAAVAGVGLWVWWLKQRDTRPVKTPPPLLSTNTVPTPQTRPSKTNPALSRAVSSTLQSPTGTSPAEPVRDRTGISDLTPVEEGAAADFTARPVRNVLEAQIALARQGFSSGPLDGIFGAQTQGALAAFQETEALAATGQLGETTRSRLVLQTAPYARYTVTEADLARLLPLGTNWLTRSQQPRLDYETILELIAERAMAHPGLIRRLNPSINWSNVPPGTVVFTPSVQYPPATRKAAFIHILLAGRLLRAFDAETNLLVQFPCSIARHAEKRPVGELHVAVAAANPDYTFDPEVFPESAEARQLGRKLKLAPGPNNPVGTAWIGLDRPGYGIHGTPAPEQVGRTESHGCFRLANWNAEHLLQLVSIGTPVFVEP